MMQALRGVSFLISSIEKPIACNSLLCCVVIMNGTLATVLLDVGREAAFGSVSAELVLVDRSNRSFWNFS